MGALIGVAVAALFNALGLVLVLRGQRETARQSADQRAFDSLQRSQERAAVTGAAINIVYEAVAWLSDWAPERADAGNVLDQHWQETRQKLFEAAAWSLDDTAIAATADAVQRIERLIREAHLANVELMAGRMTIAPETRHLVALAVLAIQRSAAAMTPAETSQKDSSRMPRFRRAHPEPSLMVRR
jgi:hypothetical protein